jgi:hypothetical protein
MDIGPVIIAMVLLAILVAWYALLEYDERRERSKTARRDQSAKFSSRAVEGEREPE